MYYGNYGCNFIGLWGGIVMALGWVIFAIIVIMLFRFFVRPSHHSHHCYNHESVSSEDSKSILQIRYAKGEISKEEYLDILKTLEK